LIFAEFQKTVTGFTVHSGPLKNRQLISCLTGIGRSRRDTIPVFVYTNGDKAELFLNGKSLGFKEKEPRSDDAVKRYRLRWDVHIRLESLKPFLIKPGLVNGTDIVKTSGKAAGIIADADRKMW